MLRRLARWFARIERYAGRWWYILAISFLAAADLFIAVVPTEGLLVTTVAMRPKHWISTFLCLALGSAIGALALATVMRHFGEPLLYSFFGDMMQTDLWARIVTITGDYGAVGLGLIAFLPIPQAPAIAICGLARMPLAAIFLSVFLGRAIKYGLLAWSATHAPRLIRRLKSVYKEVDEVVEANRE